MERYEELRVEFISLQAEDVIYTSTSSTVTVPTPSGDKPIELPLIPAGRS